MHCAMEILQLWFAGPFPSRAPADHLWVDVGVVPDLGSCRSSQPTSSPLPSPPGRTLQHYPDHFTPFNAGQGAGSVLLFSCRYIRSHLHLQSQLYSEVGAESGPLSQVLQLVRGRDRSPTLVTSELALPPATDGKGQGGGHLSLAHNTAW